jgi:hypothetical protein
MKYAHVISNNAYGTSARSNEVVFSIGQGTTSSNSVGPGQWLVRTQIAPGRYFGSPASGCYWERQKGLSGSLSDVLANEFVGFNALQWIVDIMPTDLAFETDSDCGTWSTTPRPAPSGIPPGGQAAIGRGCVTLPAICPASLTTSLSPPADRNS